MFYCEYREIFKNTFFEGHLGTNASFYLISILPMLQLKMARVVNTKLVLGNIASATSRRRKIKIPLCVSAPVRKV